MRIDKPASVILLRTVLTEIPSNSYAWPLFGKGSLLLLTKSRAPIQETIPLLLTKSRAPIQETPPLLLTKSVDPIQETPPLLLTKSVAPIPRKRPRSY